jgi:hypothetical protein
LLDLAGKVGAQTTVGALSIRAKAWAATCQAGDQTSSTLDGVRRGVGMHALTEKPALVNLSEVKLGSA